MKFIASLVLIIVSFCSLYSQNVYFPDPAFEGKLLSSSPTNTVAKNLQGNYFAIDANADGAIQVSEALEVSALYIPTTYYYQIQSIEGIEAFANLTYLDCSNSPLIERIELRNFQYLAYVDVVPANLLGTLIITDNPLLTEINFSCIDCGYYLDELDTLDCSRNNLTALNIESTGYGGGVPPLDYLDFSDNHISTFDFESYGVEFLDASGNDFTRMDIDIFDLETLIIYDNPLTYLRLYHTRLDTVIIQNFTELDSLEVIGYIGYPDNRAKHLELINLPSLEYLDCSFNYFEQLNLSNLPSLKEFTIDEMDMGLTLHNLPAITELDIDKLEYINSLKVSALDNMEELSMEYLYHPQLANLEIIDMEGLSVLNLKVDVTDFSIINAPQLDTINYVSPSVAPQNLSFTGLPDLKYVYMNAKTQDSTVHLSNLPQLNYFKNTVCNFTSLNFVDLPSLSEVILNNSYLRNLHLQNLPGLTKLDINTARIKDLVLTDLPLKVLKYNVNLDSTGRTLTFGNLPQLDTVVLNNIGITSLDFSNLPHLRDLTVNGSRWLQSFTLNNLPMLQSLELNNIWLDTLLIVGLPNLNRVTLNGVNESAYGFYMLSQFEMSDLPNLEYLSMRDNVFTWGSTINMVDLPKLNTIWYKQNYERINMADLPMLANFNLGDDILADTLDFSGCPSIENINLPDLYSPLDFMNLKNGNNSIGTINTSRAITHLCVDDQLEADLIKALDPLLVNSAYTTDCESNLCEVNRIKGTVLYNLNNNACAYSGVPCDNTRITIEGEDTFTTFTDSAGRFEYVTQSLNENFVITPHFNNDYYHADPQSVLVGFTSYGNEFDTVFCVSSDETHNDVEIIVSSGERTRPGFDFTCQVDFTNNGTSLSEGVVNLYFKDEVMDIVSVEPGYDNYAGNCLSWNYTTLAPFENRGITVTFNLNTPEDNPPLNGGEFLDFKAEILPVETDENPDDNTLTLHQMVVNSYDPNDKTCLEGDAINIEWVGDYVHYLIRFENKGTAEATFVRVKDVIDTLKFDINSFVILNSSHTCECKITDGNVIEFLFNNINLSNLAGESDGFISFKIRTRDELQLNDMFVNQAFIYFDYNAPVYTNECETIILLNVNADGTILPPSDVRVFPNPADELIHISSKHPIQQIDLLDLSGRLIKSFSGTTTLQVRDLKNGLYFIRVKQKTGVTVVKILKV